MGKRILVQRRGKGGMQYRAPSKGKLAPARYPSLSYAETFIGTITKISHERGRGAPLAQVRLEDGSLFLIPVVSGLGVGSRITMGADAEKIPGNVLPLNRIPAGTRICNIEVNYGDGGKLVKSSGGSALLFSYTPEGAVIRFPSGRSSLLPGASRASLGEIAGSGKGERPFLKAGTKFHAMKAKGRLYPRVRGMAMASVHHPFGGGRHQHSLAESRTTSRNAPPGRKVGSIAARQTGPKRFGRKARAQVK